MLTLYWLLAGAVLTGLPLLIWLIGRTPAGAATQAENERAAALGRRGQAQSWYGKHPDE